MTKEFREGERDERPEDRADELEELRGHIKARREEGAKEGDEGQSRATEDDNPADRLGEKDSPQPESPRGSSERSQENHTGQPKEENVKEAAAGRLEANDEGGRDEELGRLRERVKERREREADEEKHDVDRERGNAGKGPLEEREQDDVKEAPKTLNERPSRESEAVQNPELDGRDERAEVNRINPVGEIEGKIETSNDDKGPKETLGEVGSAEPLELGVPKDPDGRGGTQGIRDELVESSQGQPYRDENGVSSREVAHANDELRPTREASQGRIDSSHVLTAVKLEEHNASNAGDRGFQREANKELVGNVDSPTLSEDLKALRKLQSDRALLEAILGNEGFYRKEIVDLDKVIEPGRGGKDTRFVEGDTARSESDSRPYVRYAHKGPFEVGDSIPVKANLTGVPPVIRLDVLKSHIESVTGVEIDRYKLYEIKGSVKGAYDFDIHRTVGKYVYLTPSLEQRDKVQPGRVYDVSVRSVVEVPLTDAQREILGGPKKRGAWRSTMYKINHAMTEGDRGRATAVDKGKEIQTRRPELVLPEKIENINATFTSEARLHKWSLPRSQFNINGPEFERKTGVNVEEMRDYVIRGKIDGVGEFQKTLHRCAAGQHIPIYIPAKLQEKVEPGRRYQITIDSIEKLPPRKDPWEGSEEAESIRWTWREVASWVDAEGWIGGNPKRGGYHEVYVCQKERKMLEGLGRFLETEGFHPKLILNRHDGVYRLHVSGAEQAARVIKNIEPFIRTVRKKEEITNFKESIVRPRKNLWPTIRIAREILGLTEN